MKMPNVDSIHCTPTFGDEDFRPDPFTPPANRTDWYSVGHQWMEGNTLVRAAVRVHHSDTPAQVAELLMQLAVCLEDPNHVGAVRDNAPLLGFELNIAKKTP